MTDAEAQQLAQRLYDSIFGSLTKSPDGNPGAYDPNKTFLVLQKPGLLINPDDFANPWNPGNLDGSQAAAKNFSDLVDDIPNFSALYTASGRKISDLYAQVLRATVTSTSTLPPAAQAEYDKAWNLLHVKAKDEDGHDIETDSPLAITYATNQQAYANAQTAFTAQYLAAMADPQTKKTWPMLSPPLQIPVRQAWDKWRSNKADQVEAALATLATSGVNQVKRAFADAQALFDGYKVNLDAASPGVFTERSSALPSDWYKAANQNGWPTFNWSHSKSSTNDSSDFSAYGGKAGFSVGLWSVGGGASHSSSSIHSDATADSVSVSYQFSLVRIQRSWLNYLLLSLPGWHTDVAKKGGFSSGTRNGQSNNLFALLPLAFIAVKNVNIMANFSKTELDQAQSATNANASVGWGPFSISGSYSHSHSEKHFKAEIANGKISAPAVQIIGWVNSIVPLSPPQ